MVQGMGDGLVGTVLVKRYRVLRAMARGGMGIVYEARDERVGRNVAIKVLRRDFAREGRHVERLEREAMAAGALSHSNIVQVTDLGRGPSGEPFLVMELLSGTDLLAVLESEGRLAPRRAVFIAAQVLEALSATHAAGIIHRDLKPSNIFLTRLSGVDDVVKLVDFGLAKLQESKAYQRLTHTGQIVGTPSYMAPEQILGGDVDHRADLYAVGVVLFASLAGRLPHRNVTTGQVKLRSPTAEPISLTEVAPDIDPPLARVVMRALSVEADQRYRDANEMREALRPFGEAPVWDDETVRDLRESVPPVEAAEQSTRSARATEPMPARRAAPLAGAAVVPTPSRPPPDRQTQPATPRARSSGPDGVAGKAVFASPPPATKPKRSGRGRIALLLILGLLLAAGAGTGAFLLLERSPSSALVADGLPATIAPAPTVPLRVGIGPQPPKDPPSAPAASQADPRSPDPSTQPQAQPATGDCPLTTVFGAMATGSYAPPEAQEALHDAALRIASGCVRRALSRAYTVDLSVGADGRVTEVRVHDRADLTDAEGSCVESAIRESSRFGPTHDGAAAQLRVTLSNQACGG